MSVSYSDIISDVFAASRIGFPDLAQLEANEREVNLNLDCSARYVRIASARVKKFDPKAVEFRQLLNGAALRADVTKICMVTGDEPLSDWMDADDDAGLVPPKRTAADPVNWFVLDLGETAHIIGASFKPELFSGLGVRDLVLEASEDGMEWIGVYNSPTRIKERAKLIRTLAKSGHVGVSTPAYWGAALEIIIAMLSHRHAHAPKLTKGSAVPDQVIKQIRATFNETSLNARQLEWNHHGVRRSFRFWSKAEKVKYIASSSHIITKLREQLSDKVCFGFGSVLSLVRNRDLIPFDDDLDIIIAFDRNECPSMPEGFQRVVDFANRNGFEVRDVRPKSHRQIVFERGAKKVDVFVGLHEGDRVSWFPSKRGGLALHEVFPPISASMLGVECPIPANPFKYLEVVYGKNWHIEDPFFSHPWNTREYDDII